MNSDSGSKTSPPTDTPERTPSVSDARLLFGETDIGFVQSVSVNETTITESDQVAIVATIQNTGERTRTFQVNLTVFGETVAIDRVSVQAGATKQVQFVQRFDAAGTYHPEIGGKRTTVRVEPRPGTLVEQTTNRTGQPGFDTMLTLVAIGLGMMAARRRR